MATHSKVLFIIALFSTIVFSQGRVSVVDIESNIVDTKINYKLFKSFEGMSYNQYHLNRFIKERYKEGRYDSIEATTFPLKNGIKLLFTIKETPFINDIVFHSDVGNMDSILVFLNSKVGQQLNYNNLDDDVAFINQYLESRGYLWSVVKRVDMKDGALHIYIEDPKLRHVQFIGLEKTRPIVLYRELTSMNGSVVNQGLLDKDYNTLKELPYFSSVSPPIINYVNSENVTVSYRMTEKKINRMDVGIEELENDEGVALFSRFLYHHSLIYSDRVLLQAQLGYLSELNIRSYMIHYRQPWLMNRYNIRLDTKLYTVYRTELYQDDSTIYYTVRTGFSTYFTKPIKKYGVETGVGLDLETISPREDSVFDSYSLSSISYFFLIDQVDNAQNPSDGYKTKTTLEKGGRLLGVDLGGVDYFRASSIFSQYLPMTDRLVFAYRMFGGYYSKNDDISTFETEQFSLGGSNSLRGYKELSFYGDYRLSLNIEPRYTLTDQIIAVTFLDIGCISNNLNHSFLTEPYFGYGVGLRFVNTILPIRFDLGYGDDLILHFNVSHTF